ncbi:MAG TPA: hypothetical protein VK874_15820 [Gaiellaceae bacterium]|jgi:hypothetical protein|nr:hypothetical protein [Gaiellaceae bacterium]
MSGIHRFSSRVIDYAERLSDVADAAEGKHRRGGGASRWLLLPASGAALYALVKSDAFSRQAKGVVDEAKTKASELPEDLVARVRQTTERSSSSGSNGSQRSRSRSTASRKSSSTRTRKTAKSGSR